MFILIQLVSKGPLGTSPFLFCLARAPDYWTYGGTVAPNSCSFLNYDQALETTGFGSFFAFLSWSYLEDAEKAGRLRRATGNSLLAFGLVIGSIVFLTNYLLWKLPGYDWTQNPRGLPWWSEQVTYQTCFIRQADFSNAHPDCLFLNYGNVFEICVLLVFVGYVLRFNSYSE